MTLHSSASSRTVTSLPTDRRLKSWLSGAVETFKFLGSIISQDLNWDTHIDSIVKKAQRRLYFLRQLSKFNLPQELLKQFYSAVIESVLCTSITVWFGSATKSGIRRLQRTVRTAERIIGAPLLTLQELQRTVQTAERIIGAPLPTLQELYTSRVRKRAQKITLDPSHPSHPRFELLPSGRCTPPPRVHTATPPHLHTSTPHLHTSFLFRVGLEPGSSAREAGTLTRRLKATASSVSRSEVYTQQLLLAYVGYTHPPKPHSRADSFTV